MTRYWITKAHAATLAAHGALLAGEGVRLATASEPTVLTVGELAEPDLDARPAARARRRSTCSGSAAARR